MNYKKLIVLLVIALFALTLPEVATARGFGGGGAGIHGGGGMGIQAAAAWVSTAAA